MKNLRKQDIIPIVAFEIARAMESVAPDCKELQFVSEFIADEDTMLTDWYDTQGGSYREVAEELTDEQEAAFRAFMDLIDTQVIGDSFFGEMFPQYLEKRTKENEEIRKENI